MFGTIKPDTNAVLRAVISAIETTHGNLGFIAFRLHSLKPNQKDNVFIIKYSFIPREKDTARLFYKAKINIKTNNLYELEQIKEEDLTKDDN